MKEVIVTNAPSQVVTDVMHRAVAHRYTPWEGDGTTSLTASATEVSVIDLGTENREIREAVTKALQSQGYKASITKHFGDAQVAAASAVDYWRSTRNPGIYNGSQYGYQGNNIAPHTTKDKVAAAARYVAKLETERASAASEQTENPGPTR